MLSRISARMTHHSNNARTMAQGHRAQHTRAGNTSELIRLSHECLAKLKKVEINSSVLQTITDLSDKYYIDLHLLAQSEYADIPDELIFLPDESQAARERAQAIQLGRGVGAVRNFLESYSVTVPGMTLDAAITPKHKNFLIKSMQYGYEALKPNDQRAFVSAIDIDVLDKLGVPMDPEAKQLSIANRKAGKQQLSENHLLALLDYCSSYTGHFNAINDSKRVWQLCGTDKLASITACLTDSLNEALNILSTHESFVYQGPAWKGIAVLDPAGPFRLSRMQPGMTYVNPHWSSSTSIESENYARSKADERCCTLVITHAEGVRVHVFNDRTSNDEGEVMMPPKPLYFLPDPEGKTFSNGWLNLYCTMKPDQPISEGRPPVPLTERV